MLIFLDALSIATTSPFKVSCARAALAILSATITDTVMRVIFIARLLSA
jgi:hypothetical protein